MATKPTIADAAWATDTNFASGPASGTPTKVDPTGIKAQGWRPGDALGYVGAWFNYMMNQAYLWFTYLGDLHNSADFLNKAYTWVTSVHRFTGGIRMVNPRIESGDLLYTDSAGAATPRARVWRFCPSAEGTHVGGVPVATKQSANDGIVFNAGGETKTQLLLPRGITLTGLIVVVDDNSTTPMTLELYKHSYDIVGGGGSVTTKIGSTMTSSGGAAVQQLNIGVVSEVIAPENNTYFLHCSGNNNDLVYQIIASGTDPGDVGR
jgi:hypothetical protein